MTFTYQTTRHPIAIHIPTLALSTAHRAGTAPAAPLKCKFLPGMFGSHQTK